MVVDEVNNELFATFFLTNLILYLLLIEWKDVKRYSIIKVCIGITSIYAIYYNIHNMVSINNSILYLGIILIPSLLITYNYSEYRDSRTIFTFFMINIMTTIITYMVVSLYQSMDFTQEILLGVYVVCNFILLCNVGLCYKRYHSMLEGIERKNSSNLFIAISMYTIFVIFNEIKIVTYIETKLLINIGMSSLILLCYVAIFKTLKLEQELFESKDYEGDLTSQLQLQENELKVKELYYKMAYIDGLTGLENRTAYEEKLLDVQAKTRRNQRLWYISLDLNDLKTTNDILGHHKGDELIKSMASALKIIFKKYGHIFRIGGDEFVIIVDKTITELELRKKLDSLEKLLNEYGEKTRLNIKTAWGYALFNPEDGEKITEVAVRADKAMYIKKSKMKSKRMVSGD